MFLFVKMIDNLLSFLGIYMNRIINNFMSMKEGLWLLKLVSVFKGIYNIVY